MLEKLLRVPWTAKRSNQSILWEINPEYSLERLRLKLKPSALATWCEQLTHWRRPWCWERLSTGGQGWDGWVASLTQWTWVWANSRRWWRRGKPGLPQFIRSWLSDWTTTTNLNYRCKQSLVKQCSKFSKPGIEQYMNCELPVVHVGFWKDRGTRDQIANIHWIIEKVRKFQKNIYFCFIDNAKAFDGVDHNKLWKIPKQMGIPDHLICLLRNLYACQEATVRTGHGTINWFEIRKGVRQGCVLSPCLFNLYAEYIV